MDPRGETPTQPPASPDATLERRRTRPTRRTTPPPPSPAPPRARFATRSARTSTCPPGDRCQPPSPPPPLPPRRRTCAPPGTRTCFPRWRRGQNRGPGNDCGTGRTRGAEASPRRAGEEGGRSAHTSGGARWCGRQARPDQGPGGAQRAPSPRGQGRKGAATEPPSRNASQLHLLPSCKAAGWRSGWECTPRAWSRLQDSPALPRRRPPIPAQAARRRRR
mmetsp:Transcript_11358/g.21539  ORF Transcript_11358/g.21539 Transcript_11358/m.21539 type:complete len:220 (-) Transcript_11358:1137-1796(-)